MKMGVPVYACVCMCVYVSVCVCVCVSVCMCVFVCECVWVACVYTCMQVLFILVLSMIYLQQHAIDHHTNTKYQTSIYMVWAHLLSRGLFS